MSESGNRIISNMPQRLFYYHVSRQSAIGVSEAKPIIIFGFYNIKGTILLYNFCLLSSVLQIRASGTWYSKDAKHCDSRYLYPRNAPQDTTYIPPTPPHTTYPLHPTPYTPHLIPHTSHPTPHTPHLTPHTSHLNIKKPNH